MKKMHVCIIVLLTGLIGTQSFARLVDCDWYYNNNLTKNNILQINSTLYDKNLKSFRIVNVQKQMVEYYLGIRYSFDPNMLEIKPDDGAHSLATSLFCVIGSGVNIASSGQFTLYLSFDNELQQNLFYEMLTSQTDVVLAGYMSSESISYGDLKVTIAGESYDGVDLEIKIAEQLPKLYPKVTKKIVKAIKANKIKLSDIDANLSEVSNLSDYLSKSTANESLKEYISIVGLPGNVSKIVSGEEYYQAVFAYLLFLKKTKPSYLGLPADVEVGAVDAQHE
jgi:hypothetical protein